MTKVTAIALALSLVGGAALAQETPRAPRPAVAPRPALAPAPQARKVVRTKTLMGRGYLGVSLVELTPELRQHYGAPKETGVLVSRVSDDSPASRAGIRVGDVITSIDGTGVSGSFEVGRLVRKHKSGEPVAIDLVRNGAKQKYTATVAEREAKVVEIDSLDELPMIIGERGEEIAAKLEETFNSPEFKAKIARIRDCADSTAKIDALEKRLADLEKKLQK